MTGHLIGVADRVDFVAQVFAAEIGEFWIQEIIRARLDTCLRSFIDR